MTPSRSAMDMVKSLLTNVKRKFYRNPAAARRLPRRDAAKMNSGEAKGKRLAGSRASRRSGRVDAHEFGEIIRPHDVDAVAVVRRSQDPFRQQTRCVAQVIALDAAQHVEPIHDFVDAVSRHWS